MAVEVPFLVSAFPNDKFNFDSFRVQLRAADATLFADYLGGATAIDADEPTVVFIFSRPLTPTERATLDGVVAAHQGDALYISPTEATVAVLAETPGSVNGQTMFATNGRKDGEGIGNGTGVPVYWDESDSEWCVFRNDTVVQD